MKTMIRWALDSSFRSPRASYKLDPNVFAITDPFLGTFIPTQFHFKNNHLQKLYGTIWTLKGEPTPPSCLIFLHSLGTNQYEALNLIPMIVSSKLCLVCFDFPACGISEGDHIPLDGTGQDSVMSCVDYLQTQHLFKNFALWGRSMGASIALQTVSHTNMFKCVIADSGFCTSSDMVIDLGKKHGFPSCVVRLLLCFAKKEALGYVGADLSDGGPLADVSFSKTPLLMGHGKNDTFIPLRHSERLFEEYGCHDKQLYIFDARHNSTRPAEWYETVTKFIHRKLRIQHTTPDYSFVYQRALIHWGSKSKILAYLEEDHIVHEISQEMQLQILE